MKEKKKTTLADTDAIAIVDNFITEVKDITKNRENVFLKYEQFVLDGNQWDADEKEEDNKTFLTFNQSEDFINAFLAKLFPRNMETGTMDIGVKIFNKEKEKYEKEILDAYNENKLAQIILEQGQNFLIGGSGCLYYPKNPLTGKVKIISLDPTTCYLGWSGGELTQFAFSDEVSLMDAEKNQKTNWLKRMIENLLRQNSEATKEFKKVERLTYWDKNNQIIKIGKEVETRKNEDGFIPFSWIPNQPKAHRHEGISEGRKLYQLDKEYNQRASDFGNRVKNNTKATLALFTDLNTEKLDQEKIKEGILPLNKGDEAKFLTLAENKEILEYMEGISKQMANKMCINSAVTGDIKSNVSGLAMTYYFSPLLDRIGLKRIFWDEAFKSLNKAILKYAFPTEKKIKTSPIYQPVMLLDNETKINNTIRLLENNLISHKDAIDELRGMENSEEKLKEIIEELKIYKNVFNDNKSASPLKIENRKEEIIK